MKHQYTNGDIMVTWEPEKCIHSGICVQGLPEVFRPKDRPWVKIENATSAAIQEQVGMCPSGALSCAPTPAATNDNHSSLTNNTTMSDTTASTSANKQPQASTEIKVMPNGPLLVTGSATIIGADGQTTTIDKPTALCRCGASNNKPYCDGSHTKIGFKG